VVPDSDDLPTGLERLADHGPDAIGTRFTDGALTFYRILSIVLAVIAIAVLVVFTPAFSVTIWAAVIALLVVGLLGVSALNYHRLAGFGRSRPALVITDAMLEVFVPFNRMSIDLTAIRDVTVLSRDLIVLAPDGIRNGERPGRARRAVINNVRSFEVERADLANAILERARAARGQG